MRALIGSLLVLGAAAVATPAAAYIGPGLGAGTIAVVLGVLGSLVLAIVAILWYPIKRLMRGAKKPAPAKGKDGLGPHGGA